MKPVAWMVGVSAATGLAALVTVARSVRIELLLGMLGPLLMACVTWVLAQRTYRRDPQALTGLMVTGFVFKMVFFGVYVAVMLRVLRLRPVPFMASFSSYFIALHLAEAAFLRRLFAGAPGA
jgi:hypothetical protein